ncbi:FeS cluster assembly scaffold IscU [Lactarius hengduanensis]|nr:FeS cluster assembly scaffold IscU [Lactarius hengduanensis]
MLSTRFTVSTLPRLSRLATRPVGARAYHEKVIAHYERPRNVGSLPKGDIDVGTGLVGAPAYVVQLSSSSGNGLTPQKNHPVDRWPMGTNRCGDVMKLQIRVDDNGIISDVKFKTFGCGSAIASSSYMTERVKGLSLDEAGKIKNTEIAKELALPPVKLHCSMLAEDAIRSAIKDYQSKRAKLANTTQKSFIDVTRSGATAAAAAHTSQS